LVDQLKLVDQIGSTNWVDQFGRPICLPGQPNWSTNYWLPVDQLVDQIACRRATKSGGNQIGRPNWSTKLVDQLVDQLVDRFGCRPIGRPITGIGNKQSPPPLECGTGRSEAAQPPILRKSSNSGPRSAQILKM